MARIAQQSVCGLLTAGHWQCTVDKAGNKEALLVTRAFRSATTFPPWCALLSARTWQGLCLTSTSTW